MPIQTNCHAAAPQVEKALSSLYVARCSVWGQISAAQSASQLASTDYMVSAQVTVECLTTCSPTPWRDKKPSTQVPPTTLISDLIIVVGPIAHSVADIRYFFTTVLQAQPWFHDPKCIEIPWRYEHVDLVKGRPLTIGIYKWDHLIMPHPPVQRGIRIVEEALRKAGHELIEWELPDSAHADHLVVLPRPQPV